MESSKTQPNKTTTGTAGAPMEWEKLPTGYQADRTDPSERHYEPKEQKSMDQNEYIELLEQDRDAMMEQRDEYRRQRDELLEALKNMLDAVRQNIDGKPPTADQIFAKAGHQAVTAIAKTTGEV